MDYQSILTPAVKNSIRMSCQGARNEENDTVYIDSDRVISEFLDTVTPEEYANFNWERAEEVIFNYSNDLFESTAV